MDLPSLKWAEAWPQGGGRGLGSDPSTLFTMDASCSETSDSAADGPSHAMILQGVLTRLQLWAMGKLVSLHPDASLVYIHHSLYQEGQHHLRNRSTWAWWRLRLTPEPQQASSLPAALFHLSADSETAWVTLMRAYWHGLAVPAIELPGLRDEVPRRSVQCFLCGNN